MTVINVAAQRCKRGTVAGPDPWKANTLEWFTTSPPPVNNFDVVPRVRSVEPMKDIRRQIERQTRRPRERDRARRRVADPGMMARAADVALRRRGRRTRARRRAAAVAGRLRRR